MKKSIFMAVLAIIILESMNATAQEWDHEYVPFVEEGKVWNCSVRTPEVGIDEINCIFTMKGDTVIGENHYKNVFCQFREYFGDDKQHYYCAVREEACQVFIIMAETKEEKLLYDFSHPQETLILSYEENKFARVAGYHNEYIPTSQMTFGLYRSKDGLNYNNELDDWIEGVGSVNVNPFACELICDKPSFGYPIDVISCIINEDAPLFLIYWFESPTSIRSALKSVPNTNAQIYDLQGHPVTGKPTRGLYIQNGRKVYNRGSGTSAY